MWVSCFGIIAPVQAWSFANSLFDTRQAKRLFGLIGAGASLGAITGGLLARRAGRAGRRHGQPAAGAGAADCVGGGHRRSSPTCASAASGRAGEGGRFHGPSPRPGRRSSPARTSGCSRASSSRSRSRRSGRRCSSAWSPRTILPATPTDITEFYRPVQLHHRGLQLSACSCWSPGGCSATGASRPPFWPCRWRMATGNFLILLSPGFWSVLLTNGLDQGFRFSVDKAGYELLYLPIPRATGRRSRTPSTSSSIGSPMPSVR